MLRIEVQLDIPLLLADPKSLESRLVKSLSDELKIINRLFDRFTATWTEKNKPTWKSRIRLDREDLLGEIETDSRVMVWVGEGTGKRHATVAGERGHYKPKTRAGSIQSRSGGYVGPTPNAYPIVSRRINKPGIVARKPHDRIVEIRRKFYVKRIGTQVTRWANTQPGKRRKVTYVI